MVKCVKCVTARESVITDNSLVVCWSCVQVLWTGRPCQNFHLLLCIAVLVSEKTVLIENNFGFTEILKVCRPCTFTSIVFDLSQNDAWIYTADDWRINVKIRYSLCLIFVNVLNNDIETKKKQLFHSITRGRCGGLDMSDPHNVHSQTWWSTATHYTEVTPVSPSVLTVYSSVDIYWCGV